MRLKFYLRLTLFIPKHSRILIVIGSKHVRNLLRIHQIALSKWYVRITGAFYSETHFIWTSDINSIRLLKILIAGFLCCHINSFALNFLLVSPWQTFKPRPFNLRFKCFKNIENFCLILVRCLHKLKKCKVFRFRKETFLSGIDDTEQFLSVSLLNVTGR